MKLRISWMHVLAPAFVVALAASGTHAATSARVGADVPAMFGANLPRETQGAHTVSFPGSALDGIRQAGELDDATQVAARCRARRSRGGTGRSAGIASPSIVNIPNEEETPKPPEKVSETSGSGGYYDENGVFHGDLPSSGGEAADRPSETAP